MKVFGLSPAQSYVKYNPVPFKATTMMENCQVQSSPLDPYIIDSDKYWWAMAQRIITGEKVSTEKIIAPYNWSVPQGELFIFEKGKDIYTDDSMDIDLDLSFLERDGDLGLHDIGTFDFAPKAREQSIRFSNKAPVGEKIVDGFRWNGKNAQYDEIDFNHKYPNAQREIVVIDRASDKILRRGTEVFKNAVNLDMSEKEKITLMFYFIDKVFRYGPHTYEETEVFHGALRHNPSKEVLLGNLMKEGEGVCRHKALLAKVLADEVGIKMNIVSNNKHVWNETVLDGERCIFDPMTEALFSLDNPHPDALEYFKNYT